MKIVNISIIDKLSHQTVQWNGRPVYLILHTYGKEPSPLEFYFDVEIPQGWTSSSTVDIAIIGSYVQTRTVKTPQYQNLLKSFPDWADVASFLGAYESWVV